MLEHLRQRHAVGYTDRDGVRAWTFGDSLITSAPAVIRFAHHLSFLLVSRLCFVANTVAIHMASL
jgi:hypothetical protein